MISVLNQHGFVIPQFAWVTIAVFAIIFLLIDFAPSDARHSGELAKATNARTGVRSIAAKSSLYYADTMHLPESIDDLLSNSRNVPNWKGPYITEQQSMDAWGHRYILRNPGARGQIDVVSLGADGLVGGVGNNADFGSLERK